MTLSAPPTASLASETAIEFRGVSKHFLKDETVVPVLSDVTLSVGTGQFVALVGPSGCGKSTLLNLVSGLVRPSAGTVLYQGDPVKTVNSRVGYVTQRDNLVPWRTVLANLELPLELRGVPRPERIARARELVAQVGLAGFENHYPSELSGGMRKRVSLARAFIYGAKTLLMDEPFGALDAQLKLLIEAELMRLWQASRQTILYVTHDLHEAIVLADWVIVFSARPARIRAIQPIDIPRPRDLTETRFLPEFRHLHETLWELLRPEASLQEAVA
ncbi:MAG TPA: ABC transporter ATP-binding protein [Stellaceae bacterium]|jgi:NitT/TauT family transport system ATP-binding protein|nr:ABC transporter ATP-binding protein [Stellaceae bacterium]